MKMKPQEILAEARRLKDEQFSTFHADLKDRHGYRFQQVKPVVPLAYRDTADAYTSPALEEEGRQAGSLIYAPPVPHIPPPRPEDQALTTKGETFLSAMFQELEAEYGSIWWKNTMAQLHDKISWVYFGMKRKPYDGQPDSPDDSASIGTLLGYADKNRTFKQEAGIASVFDYRHVPTNTVCYVGNYRNPLAVYEIKEVDERELMLQYDLKKDSDGKLTLPDNVTTLPSGTPEGYSKGAVRKLRVVEYWDKTHCMIVVENGASNWRGSAKTADALVLDEWEHNWGRTPYFAAPAFENEVTDERYKFSSPLDPLYSEIPEYNVRRTMASNRAHLTSYPSWQDVADRESDSILDDKGQPKGAQKYEPGKVYNTLPGHKIENIPMVVSNDIYQELRDQEARIRQFTLSDISKGVSPGADTANSAITQLRRLQRSALSPLNKNQADQAREMFKFALKRIKGEEGEGVGETVYIYSASSGEMIDLSPEDIVTLNLQTKVAPDTGQDMLIEEKQAAELKLQGLISELEFHERRGKENPEEFVRANVVERLWMILEPQMQQQILASLGNSNAIAQMIAAKQQGGEAGGAVPDIMAQIAAQQSGDTTGMGSGSSGMPRAMGVRSPEVQMTTQPGANGQFGGA